MSQTRRRLPRIERQELATVAGTLLGTRNGNRWALLGLALLVGSMTTFGNTVFGVLSNSLPDASFWRIALLLGQFPGVVALLWIYLNWQRRNLQVNAKVCPITPHAGVLLPLSSLTPEVERQTQTCCDAGQPLEILFQSTRHPWQQALRALRPHQEGLRWVGLIVSKESRSQGTLFIQVARQELQLPATTTFTASDDTEFNQVNALVLAMETLLGHALKQLRPTELALDTTGGTKPVTLAGLLVAMTHDGLALQYVDTNPPHQALRVDYAPHLR